jgi:pimeloyl-ACP methyl ester carboxylesterase
MKKGIDSKPVRTVDLHGHSLAYRQTGVGPVILLVHGLAGTMGTWDAVVDELSTRFTAVTVDLPGHGRSEPWRGDSSIGTYANALRDLLDQLGHATATIVGHSLGGGVALQFAYQYPQRCERLVLVSSGGLGNEISAVLRAAALPGADHALAIVAHRHLIAAGRTAGRLAAAVGIRPSPGLLESARSYATLADAEVRDSFVRTLRGVIDHRGQRLSAHDRLYLMDDIPCLLIWGDHDRIIPIEHGCRAHRAMVASRLEIFPGAGHFPHADDPDRFVRTLDAFIDTTTPVPLTRTITRTTSPRISQPGPPSLDVETRSAS